MNNEVKEHDIWLNIIKVAQNDGRISKDESSLIEKIISDAKVYQEVLDQAIEDQEITEDEKTELINRRADILNNAYRQASEDYKITEEEMAIIKETLKILHQLELEEDEFSS